MNRLESSRLLIRRLLPGYRRSKVSQIRLHTLDTTIYNVYIPHNDISYIGEGVSGQENIAKILLESIPRELLLNFERHYPSALDRALQIGQSVNKGHRASVVGHNRHFFLNEALMVSLDECEVPHAPLRGNKILIGKVGLAAIARVHMNSGKWDNSRRSKAKVKLCAPNRLVASMVQIDWLLQQEPQEIAAVTAFLVTEGDGTDANPCQAYIVVPDENMDLRNPIFEEPLTVFVRRYQHQEVVVDSAQPKLKPNVKKQSLPDES